MPADTLQSMILGFVAIFFVLGAYIISLVIRVRNAKKRIEPPARD